MVSSISQTWYGTEQESADLRAALARYRDINQNGGADLSVPGLADVWKTRGSTADADTVARIAWEVPDAALTRWTRPPAATLRRGTAASLSIMLVEGLDQPEHLEQSLADDGHRVTRVDGCQASTTLARMEPATLVLIDLCGPDHDGLLKLADIAEATRAPIVALTNTGGPAERTLALKLGADDVMQRPVDQALLVARMRAVLRRYGQQHTVLDERDPPLECGQLRCLPLRVLLYAHQRVLHVPATERRLLTMLLRQPGEVLTFAQLGREVWGFEPTTWQDRKHDRHTLQVHIGRLRRRLEAAEVTDPTIETVRGRGIRLSSQRPAH